MFTEKYIKEQQVLQMQLLVSELNLLKSEILLISSELTKVKSDIMRITCKIDRFECKFDKFDKKMCQSFDRSDKLMAEILEEVRSEKSPSPQVVNKPQY